jgi:hypothetical protein
MTVLNRGLELVAFDARKICNLNITSVRSGLHRTRTPTNAQETMVHDLYCTGIRLLGYLC